VGPTGMATAGWWMAMFEYVIVTGAGGGAGALLGDASLVAGLAAPVVPLLLEHPEARSAATTITAAATLLPPPRSAGSQAAGTSPTDDHRSPHVGMDGAVVPVGACCRERAPVALPRVES